MRSSAILTLLCRPDEQTTTGVSARSVGAVRLRHRRPRGPPGARVAAPARTARSARRISSTSAAGSADSPVSERIGTLAIAGSVDICRRSTVSSFRCATTRLGRSTRMTRTASSAECAGATAKRSFARIASHLVLLSSSSSTTSTSGVYPSRSPGRRPPRGALRRSCPCRRSSCCAVMQSAS